MSQVLAQKCALKEGTQAQERLKEVLKSVGIKPLNPTAVSEYMESLKYGHIPGGYSSAFMAGHVYKCMLALTIVVGCAWFLFEACYTILSGQSFGSPALVLWALIVFGFMHLHDKDCFLDRCNLWNDLRDVKDFELAQQANVPKSVQHSAHAISEMEPKAVFTLARFQNDPILFVEVWFGLQDKSPAIPIAAWDCVGFDPEKHRVPVDELAM